MNRNPQNGLKSLSIEKTLSFWIEKPVLSVNERDKNRLAGLKNRILKNIKNLKQ
ncbi:MAG: hypothetical protein KAX28_00665 [Candidatus Marinimicrobia bacterium]|nr:hypothetical protein [Candidatus Neomarinimicrobiota bacterium]